MTGVKKPRPASLSQIIETTTADYLASLDHTQLPSPRQIEAELISKTNISLQRSNELRLNDEKFTKLRNLTFSQTAQILLSLHHVVKIAPAGKNTDPDYDLLALYSASGAFEGTYLTAEDDIRRVARLYDHQLRTADFKEVLAVLRESAPRKNRCEDPNLIALNNGIFNYETNELLNFDSSYIFLSKSLIDFNPLATSPTITHPDRPDWEVEEWMQTLSDDPEIVNLLWHVIGAVIRPNVSWNKSAWFYSEVGNNGKGTLVELMRGLCGPGAYASLPLADMSKDFMLEPLTRATAIITDENDVGTFIDKAANLKAIITNDVLMINRKHKAPISYQFKGFMVQCLNEFPRIKDKSDSFYRRQLFIPFDKTFTGKEKKWIKDSYVSHPEVLQYVLKKVLIDLPKYYSLPEPEATHQVLIQYKEYNDPVRAFWSDLKDNFTWDLLPFTFLYDLFKSWFHKNNPSGQIISNRVFISDLLKIVYDDEDWSGDRNTKIRSANKMDLPEPLIVQYDLSSWKNPNYQGSDITKVATPLLTTSYRGLVKTI